MLDVDLIGLTVITGTAMRSYELADQIHIKPVMLRSEWHWEGLFRTQG